MTSACTKVIFCSDVVDWSFVSSAYPSALIWSRRSLRYSFDQDELRGFYSEVSSIKRVFFSVSKCCLIAEFVVLDNTPFEISGLALLIY